MLGKLVKYEMKSTARVFLPMYLILIFFAIFSRFSVSDLTQNTFNDNRFFEILSGVMIMGYVFAILSVLIVTFVIIIQRFFKNLTGDEGYLMHTLPVSTHSLVQSKLIGAFIWEFLSTTMVFVSLFVLFVQPEFFSELPIWIQDFNSVMSEIWGDIGMGLVNNILLILGAMVISTLTSTLMIYAAMSIGHTFKKHRVMGSVLAYMGISMISSFIAGIFSSVFTFVNFNLNLEYMADATKVSNYLSGIFLLVIATQLAFAAAWYFVTHYVLTHQLNLE